MKYLNSILFSAAALLLVASVSAPAQQPGGPNQQPPGEGQRGGRGRGGFGGGRGGLFGPQLPAEQQAEVDRITAALDAEAKAVAAANSNLVAATFSTPVDKAKIAKANDELTKAREAWAAKASKLFAETQASDKKLSQDAIARLVQMSSGRGGRGGFGPGGPGGRGGFGRGGPGGPDSEAPGRRGGSPQ